MLTERRKKILNLIIDDYISFATPVASETISRNYPDKVSSATIRNEVILLDGDGYVYRTHISSGSIPSDKGYRYYVENMLTDVELPFAEKNAIRQSFLQIRQELEEWGKFAASILAQKAKNISMVTLSKASECRLRHLELIYLREMVTLMVIVFQQVRVKKQLLTFDKKVSVSELEIITNKLNSLYTGLNRSEIEAGKFKLAPAEEMVTSTLLKVMKSEDEANSMESYFEGLRYLLTQPEFSKDPKLAELLKILEEGQVVKAILAEKHIDQGIEVIIGNENKEEMLKNCSIILGSYGVSGKITGTIGVIGPTRMRYMAAISTIRYLSDLMSQVMADLP